MPDPRQTPLPTALLSRDGSGMPALLDWWWFNPGRWLYLRRPNRYLWLYDLPGIDHYLPLGPSADWGADRDANRRAHSSTEAPHQSARRHPVGTGSADFQSTGREDDSA